METSGKKKIIELPNADSSIHDIDAGIATFKKKIQDEPNNPEPYFILATLHLRRDRVADAISLLEQCLQHKQNHQEALFLLGNCYLRFDQYEIGARYFMKALKVNANHSASLYNIGLCYLELGMKDKAIAALKKFLSVEESASWREDAKFQLYKLGISA